MVPEVAKYYVYLLFPGHCANPYIHTYIHIYTYIYTYTYTHTYIHNYYLYLTIYNIYI